MRTIENIVNSIIPSSASKRLGLISSLKIPKVNTPNNKIRNIEMIGFALYPDMRINLPIPNDNNAAGRVPTNETKPNPADINPSFIEEEDKSKSSKNGKTRDFIISRSISPPERRMASSLKMSIIISFLVL